mmetsp:Transcript_7803/g.16755  ORF Transcript_7803/g.16755 Transcript_7803/m.16755 type:complete len:269 (+) Transcript_7803:85-891(+)|eukprot:CAMPEP_0168187564 /NCGR_PEP_ID=MMETSP0139_2-20121125/15109_1 /TAXON_ID=44445 /ORGANISM="Pseudo-nitzschia australis, Strain 10249 10 AB" /LENGTH=268 /DNA_ID=CAMNT_0008109799 /DNA_START=81 /DNA_END=887 /DNA_ORIENTATION=+
MDSYYSSLLSTPSTTTPLVMRGAFLFVLVVLFQWLVARAPNVQKESKRRFQHALTGHALVQISHALPKSVSLALLSIASIGMYLAKTFFFEEFLRAFGGLLRPKELSGEVLPGAFYFLIGTAITVSGLVTEDIRIARYSVECLALADPMASWIGSTIPSPKLYTVSTDRKGGTRTSSLSGCLACFGTALVVGWWMLVLSDTTTTTQSDNDTSINETNSTFKFTFSTLVAGALACTIAEGLPFGNDNLNIPVITAFVVDQFASASAAGR